ncbi:unnamed protein product [Psylliodes chrysocephalus]|uniref:Cilia- and flagella-associated protein 100-like n=1 Tax=Psylliodes chrysocephalus TaxID=3402493 RepID=A0A9P0CTS2_9CUCU|nr:unnamed protein product [Psylliodes chrysocephala]
MIRKVSQPQSTKEASESSSGASYEEPPSEQEEEAKVSVMGSMDVCEAIDKTKIKKWKASMRKPFIPVRQRKRLVPKYFSDDKKVTEATIFDLDKEPCPFRPPRDSKMFAHKLFTGEYKRNFRTVQNRKAVMHKLFERSRLNKNLGNRLYVKVPPDNIRTVLNFDGEYNKAVEGRQISDVFNVQRYVETVRDVLKHRILLGYREDDIMLLNENIENEQRAISHINKYLSTYSKTLEDVLAKDHLSATNMMKKQRELEMKLYEEMVELKNLKKKYNTVKAGLYSSEERWKKAKRYQRFLIYISPLHWKKEHADQVKEYDLSKELTPAEEEEMFDEATYETIEMPFDDMLEIIIKACRTNLPPELYFKAPEELLDIFKYMESQNMNYLLHAEELAVPLEKIKQGMEVAAASFDKQIISMNSTIRDLAKAIEWEENRVDELERMAMSLIYTEFKQLIMADDILNMHVFVEDVYESRIGPNDANLNVLEMMRSIEKRYRSEILLMDKIPHEIVHALEGSTFSEQSKVIKFAELAEKKFAELELSLKKLKRAYAPPFEKGPGKEPKRRSRIPVPVRQKVIPQRKLTLQEIDYLEYFTDFCQFTDDADNYTKQLSLLKMN